MHFKGKEISNRSSYECLPHGGLHGSCTAWHFRHRGEAVSSGAERSVVEDDEATPRVRWRSEAAGRKENRPVKHFETMSRNHTMRRWKPRTFWDSTCSVHGPQVRLPKGEGWGKPSSLTFREPHPRPEKWQDTGVCLLTWVKFEQQLRPTCLKAGWELSTHLIWLVQCKRK